MEGAFSNIIDGRERMLMGPAQPKRHPNRREANQFMEKNLSLAQFPIKKHGHPLNEANIQPTISLNRAMLTIVRPLTPIDQRMFSGKKSCQGC